MASDFQKDKRQIRKDGISNKRERRRDSELREMAPRGLGSRRTKMPVPQPPKQDQAIKAPAPKQPSLPPPPVQKPAIKPLIRRDRIEISEEAYKRYQEEIMLQG